MANICNKNHNKQLTVVSYNFYINVITLISMNLLLTHLVWASYASASVMLLFMWTSINKTYYKKEPTRNYNLSRKLTLKSDVYKLKKKKNRNT